MSSRCRSSAAHFALAALVLGAVVSHRAGAASEARVCIDETNPTAAMDARVARAALASGGYTIREIPFVGHGKEAGDGFPIGKFAKMAASECALIMGFPVDVSNPHLPPGVTATAPYARTGFVLVENAGGKPATLDEFPQGSEVGIAQLDTWAGLLYSAHPNIVMHVYPNDAEMLVDLEHHKIAAGLTWLSILEGYRSGPGKHVRLRTQLLSGQHMEWNLVALHAGAGGDVAAAFGRGIDTLRHNGTLDKLIAPYPAAVEAGGGATTGNPSRAAAARGCDGKVAAKPPKRKAGPPAMYTEAQATAGQIAYAQNCSMCHGPLLTGQVGGYPGPALKGEDFADPSYDFHVSDIFNFVALRMPAATPGSLPKDVNVAIMAYLLRENGYPAGDTALTYDGAMKSNVPIRYYGK